MCWFLLRFDFSASMESLTSCPIASVMETLNFQPIMHPLIAAAAVAGLLAMLLVGPSFARLPGNRRFVLTALRVAAISLIALAIFRPGCISNIEKKQSALLLFLIDDSRSMELPHRADQSQRWAALKQMIVDNSNKFQALKDQEIDVRFFAFNNQVAPLELDGPIPKLAVLPTGTETDIGTALLKTSRDVRDQRLIGVVLATDGMQNANETEIELMDAVSLLVDQEIPLWGVPFGLPADVGQLADIAVTNLADQHAVFVKNRLSVKSTIVSRGFANQNVMVQLFVSSKDNVEEVLVDTKYVTPQQAYEEQQVEFSYIPDTPGRFRLAVRAEGMPNEVALRNNELPSFLTVYDGGLRVLYFEGNLGWEQSFLRRTIPTAAQGIELEFVPIYKSTRDKWPAASLKGFFEDNTIDVFIIGDLDSRALFRAKEQETYLRLLEQRVAAGKGLLMLGGYHSFGPGLYGQTPLADVLPIIMTDGERQEFDRDIRKDLHIERAIKLRPTKDHFLTRIDEDPDPRARWAKLPPLVGANLFQGIKDTADVLLESETGQPILVAGNYGAGRVISFAGDSTWRWWTHDYEAEYKRFWRQILLWLAFRDGRSNDNVWIDLAQRRFQPQSQVAFTTGARNATGQPLIDATFDARLIAPDGTEHMISVSKRGDLSTAQLDKEWLTQPGVFTIRVEGNVNSEKIGKTEVEFVIFDQDKEKANPAADPQLLARMSDQTKSFGGRAVVPEELGTLLDEIASNPPEMKIMVPQKWQLGQTAIDGSLFLILFVGLISVEWGLRKKWGLV